MELSQDRIEVLKRIEEYERLGYFDRDVENDPPTRPLRPGEVDYTLKKWTSRLSSEIANEVARRHFDKCIKRGELVIKEVRGIENYRAVKQQGVMITANHFNAFDNYAVFKAIQKDLGRKRLYKIIREGNYTSFPGIYGYFFRHCNTLPLSADHRAFRELRDAIAVLLGRGEKILIYPEQGMWWNYRKPRPMQDGAFSLAVRNNAPVVPIFITMEDSDVPDGDGFFVQEYTLHILPAIYPDKTLSHIAAKKDMKNRNYEAWVKTYEEFYGKPLVYGES